MSSLADKHRAEAEAAAQKTVAKKAVKEVKKKK